MSIHIAKSWANRIQAEAIADDDLLVWTLFDHPIDYPEKYIARPFSTKRSAALDVHLEDDTIEGLRTQLPRGLVYVPADATDDSKILESWL